MRNKHGIYLGVSPFHSSTVHLVRNPATVSITPRYHLVFDAKFSTVFSDGQFDPSIWTNLLSHGYKLHATVQLDSTGSIPILSDCIPFDAASTTLPSPEGTVPEEFVQPPTFHSPSSPKIPDDDKSTSLDSPISFDHADYLGSTPPSSSIEGAPPTDHPSLSPTEEVSSSTPAPRRYQRSTTGAPPDHLSILAYDAAHHIQRPPLPGSTQTVFHTNSGQKLPDVSREKIQNSYLANLQGSSLLTMCSTKHGTLHSFIAEHQQFLSYSIKGKPLVNYLNPAMLQSMINCTGTSTFTDGMNGPDSARFLRAMESEMSTLIDMDAFDVVKYLSKHKVISSVWVFKVK